MRHALTKDQKDEQAAAEKVLAWLQEGKDVRMGDWTQHEVDWLNQSQASAGQLAGCAAGSRRGCHRRCCWWQASGLPCPTPSLLWLP